MIRKEFGTIVFIGRFQGPVHNAHVEILKRANEMADRVIVVIGSCNQPRTVKNPFTGDERQEVIQHIWNKFAKLENLRVVQVEDRMYNNLAWAIQVQEQVDPLTVPNRNIGLIGHKKDASSFYLDMFPQWETVEQPLISPLDASSVRSLYFDRGKSLEFLRGVMPADSMWFLERFQKTKEYGLLVRQKEFLEDYRKQYLPFPYPVTFVTTDAVVIQSGHVLLTTRDQVYGEGLLALPGGFLDARTDASMLDAALRELYEETSIRVPEKVMRGSFKGTRVFDAIERSERGRTITHAHKFILEDGHTLPKVKGGSDARHADWYPIGSLRRDQIFEDHDDIIKWVVAE